MPRRLSNQEIFQLGNFLKDIGDEHLPFPTWDVCLAYIKSEAGLEVTQNNLESILKDDLSEYDIKLVAGRTVKKSDSSKIADLEKRHGELVTRFNENYADVTGLLDRVERIERFMKAASKKQQPLNL